jgi:uncharacterized protein with von Willebrand factor type A (vWA) domain
LDTEDDGPIDFRHRDIYRVLDEEEVRKVLTYPRQIPRKLRTDIARFLVDEMRGTFRVKDIRKFLRRFGAFYPLITYLREMRQWKELKEMTEGNQVGQTLVLLHLLPLMYDLMERLPRSYRAEWEMDDKVQELLERFRKLMEKTMELWGGEMPSADSVEWAEIDQQMHIVLSEDEAGIIEEFIRKMLEELMGGVLDTFKDQYEILETLLLLFPGRFWDYSRRELHNTFLGDLEKYAKLLRDSSKLRDILDMLGRIEIEYNAMRADLTHFGSSEVFSIHTSKDLKHVLPAELVKLRDPTLKNLFLAQFVEGKLLTYQLRGKNWDEIEMKEEGRKGPVIALVDTSASMHGAPEVTAKATVLAAAKKLLKEKRDLKVILFSSIDQTVEIELTDRNRMATHFLEFLQLSFGGGTDFNTALREGLKNLRTGEWKDADLLFLTDGYSVISDQNLLQEWSELKAEHGVRCFAMIIGNDNAGGLAPISDKVFILKRPAGWDRTNSPVGFLKLL